MTPDELRRLDNDACIIFVKGLKPIKAGKYYYFKHQQMAKELQEVQISHNDIGEIERGSWRKYNPYNPYVEEKDDDKKPNDLKVESLDDLFEDVEEPKKEENKNQENKKQEAVAKTNTEPAELDFTELKIEEDDAPILPQASNDEEYDLQKELEAKFDELFGPIDED